MEENQVKLLEQEREKRIAEKKLSLLIDELELRRDKEEKYKLTEEEIEKQHRLELLFNNKHPVKRIQNAIDDEEKLKKIRKKYLEASKELRDKENNNNKINSESDGLLLLATGVPLIIIGYIISDTFKSAGIAVMVVGALMNIPFFINEQIKKRKAKREYKEAESFLNELSEEIDSKSSYIDDVCCEYGLPINTIEKSKDIYPILEAAKEYEDLGQKESDYELLVQLNNSDKLKREIEEILEKLTGQKVTNEKDFHEIMTLIDKNIMNSNLIEKGEDR